jgi:probable F420-dependent oxidoreductase
VATKLVLVLSENWAMTSPRELRRLVAMAVDAETAGFDAVMVSEHVVLGPDADASGRMRNPREFAGPGNQDPATPWPSSIVLLSAIAATTTRLRLLAAAIIAPLRHPILLAKELATLDLLCEGRLVVLPTVSWHRQEYEALGVPWNLRGELLDEHLAAWRVLWRDTPASFTGSHYNFTDVYLEPKPYRLDGPALWFGGGSLYPRLLRRLTEYGSGFCPFHALDADGHKQVAMAMAKAGRSISELELVGGTRGRLVDSNSLADLDEALASIPKQTARGFDTICIKPSQFNADARGFAPWCRDVVARVAALDAHA